MNWLADVLRKAGLSVQELPGWQTRGHGAMSDVLGVLLHHTAGPAAGNYPSLAVVRDGRPGLDGPLANLGLARDGTWIVIAAGVSWHAGLGKATFCPADQGNQHLIGVEAESTGRGDWTPQQLNAYPRGVAALLAHLNLTASRAIAHREWAPSRKIDPAGIDMPTFRLQVAALIPVMTGRLKPSGVFMALTDAEQAELLALVRKLKPGVVLPGRGKTMSTTRDDHFGWAITGAGQAADALAEVQSLRKEVAALRAEVARLNEN